MENPTSIILSRMIQASRVMEVVANNVSNSSTPGYKSLHLDATSWRQRMKDTETPDGGSALIYSSSHGTWMDSRAGVLHQTGNPLDFALTKPGYFTVQTSSGIRLTRDGQFTISADGTLVTASGDAVLNNAGQLIKIPAGSKGIFATSNGMLTESNHIIGQIAVVNVKNVNSLVEEGSNLFHTLTATTPVASPGIVQGSLEGSNVKPIKEISDMLLASQNFKMISQFISAEQLRSENEVSKIISAT